MLFRSAEGSGKGVSGRSKVANKEELLRTAADLLQRFRQPVLAETFLPGCEFTVAILGTGEEAEALGVLEIVFLQETSGAYTYDNKSHWEGKVDVRHATDAKAGEAAQLALAAWRALRGRDCGRIDIRCDAEGKPHFLEINPLPGMRPGYSDLCFKIGRAHV